MDTADPVDCRCTATNRRGQRCGRRPIPGGTVCVMHGGGAPQVQAAAERRLEDLRPLAVRYLDWLLSQREYPSAGLGAAKDVLDRNDGKPHESIAVAISGEVTLAQKVAAARKRLGEQNP